MPTEAIEAATGIRRCNSPLHVGERDLPATEVFYYRRPSTGRLADVCLACVRERDRRYRAARRVAGGHASSRRIRNANIGQRVAATVPATGNGRTFGVEIEFTGAYREDVARELNRLGNEHGIPALANAHVQGPRHQTHPAWTLVSDVSCGYELVSPPLAGEDGRRQLTLACQALRSAGARVNASCGVHVHHGMADMSADAIVRAIRSYTDSQAAINWLVDATRRNNSMCRPMDSYAVAELPESSTTALRNYCERMAYQARFRSINVRPFAAYGTVEIRQHQGSLNARKILAWVDFGQALFAASAAGHSIATTDPEALIGELETHGQLPATAGRYLRQRATAFQNSDRARQARHDARGQRIVGQISADWNARYPRPETVIVNGRRVTRDTSA